MATRLSGRRATRAGAAGILALAMAGCGIGASTRTPVGSGGGPPTQASPGLTAAVAQTKAAIGSALGTVAVQFGDATRPYRPAESARLRAAPRATYQVNLPDQTDAGFIVVYEFRDTASAIDAGNEEAGYLGSGEGTVQFPPGTQHVIRAVGTTLILFSWTPGASDDAAARDVAAALSKLGIGFAVPR
jgi:hypothetical protein